jgi:hypothetical protein
MTQRRSSIPPGTRDDATTLSEMHEQTPFALTVLKVAGALVVSWPPITGACQIECVLVDGTGRHVRTVVADGDAPEMRIPLHGLGSARRIAVHAVRADLRGWLASAESVLPAFRVERDKTRRYESPASRPVKPTGKGTPADGDMGRAAGTTRQAASSRPRKEPGPNGAHRARPAGCSCAPGSNCARRR